MTCGIIVTLTDGETVHIRTPNRKDRHTTFMRLWNAAKASEPFVHMDELENRTLINTSHIISAQEVEE